MSIQWKFEGGACPRYMARFPTGDVYVETHGPTCMSKERTGVWSFVGTGTMGQARVLRAKDGPGACREAAEGLAAKLEQFVADLRASVQEG